MPDLIEVSIDLVKCGQSVVAKKVVRFRAKAVATNGSGKTVLTFSEEVETDENGQTSVMLWPGIPISVILPDGSKGNIVVPEVGTPSLDELLVTSPAPTDTISAAIASAVATHAARKAAAGILGHIIPDGVTITVDPETGIASASASGGGSPNYIQVVSPPNQEGYAARGEEFGSAAFTNNAFNLLAPKSLATADYNAFCLCRVFDRTKRNVIGLSMPFEPLDAEYSGPRVGLSLPCADGDTVVYVYGKTGFFSSTYGTAYGAFSSPEVPAISQGSSVKYVPGTQFFIVEPYMNGIRVYVSPDGYAPGTLILSDSNDRGWSHIGPFVSLNTSCVSDARVRFFHDSEETFS